MKIKEKNEASKKIFINVTSHCCMDDITPKRPTAGAKLSLFPLKSASAQLKIEDQSFAMLAKDPREENDKSNNPCTIIDVLVSERSIVSLGSAEQKDSQEQKLDDFCVQIRDGVSNRFDLKLNSTNSSFTRPDIKKRYQGENHPLSVIIGEYSNTCESRRLQPIKFICITKALLDTIERITPNPGIVFKTSEEHEESEGTKVFINLFSHPFILDNSFELSGGSNGGTNMSMQKFLAGARRTTVDKKGEDSIVFDVVVSEASLQACKEALSPDVLNEIYPKIAALISLKHNVVLKSEFKTPKSVKGFIGSESVPDIEVFRFSHRMCSLVTSQRERERERESAEICSLVCSVSEVCMSLGVDLPVLMSAATPRTVSS